MSASQGSKLSRWLRDIRRQSDGSAVAEFVMVIGLLTILTLSVIQLGLALLIRNTAQDAAAEGARFAALADNGLADGVGRATELLTVALGPSYAGGVSGEYGTYLGHPSTVITVRVPLPLIGLVGVEHGLEVSGHAAVESIDH